MLYWPQPYLPPRVQIWSAVRVAPGQPAQPYVELQPSLQHIAAIVLELIWQWTFNGHTEFDGIVRDLLNIFVPVGDVINFVDKWYNVLPMDNSIEDPVMPTCFTECWVDPKDITEAMKVIRNLHGADPSSIGNFFTEIYTAKQSPFWLSPSNSGDKIRLDINWFQFNAVEGDYLPPYEYANPVPYFSKHWDALDKAGIHFTTHLGKYRPESHCTVKNLKEDYEHYEEWLKIREAFDPDQVFLTDYWARHLQIEKIR